jgi:hypothetical protein
METSNSNVNNDRIPVFTHIGNDGQVYLVETISSEYIKISKFNALGTSPISPSYYKTYGTASYHMVGTTAYLTSDLSSLYIGGSIAAEPLLLKVYSSSGASDF